MLPHPFDSVREFHETYDLARGTVPALPAETLRQLRIDLLREEMEEYIQGETNDDIVEIADALADIIYIACGTAVAYGIPLDRVFAEVHRSNMSKLDADGKPIYREDGKVLKGPLYSPPDVRGVLAQAVAAS